MALNHAPICTCNECATGKLSQAGGSLAPFELNDPDLARILAEGQAAGLIVPDNPPYSAVTCASNTAAPVPEAAHIPGYAHVAEGVPLPWQEAIVGYVVIATGTIEGGAINVLIVRDPVSLSTKAIYWKRNAETSGRGEWAVVNVNW